MSYKVIHCFSDLQDNNYVYCVGATFPRNGFNVSQNRLEQLSSSNNKQGKPLIEFVADKKVVLEEIIKSENQYTKTEINRMSTADLKALAKSNGIEDAEDISGAELKKLLIKKFNL